MTGLPPSSTLPIVMRGPRPPTDVWDENRGWRARLVGSALFIAFGALMGGTAVFLSLRGTGPPHFEVYLVLVVVLTFPVSLGVVSLWRGLRSPRAIGSTLEAMYFQYFRMTKAIPYREMAGIRAGKGLLRDARLIITLSNGATFTARGIPTFTLEGVVSHAERRAPQVMATAEWPASELRGGERLPDFRMVEGLGAKWEARKDAWVTLTDAIASPAYGRRATLYLMLPLLIAVNFVFAADVLNLDPLLALGGLGVALAFMTFGPLYLRLRNPPGSYGASSLSLSPRGLSFDAASSAIEGAIAAAGLQVTKSKARVLLGTRSAKWSTSAGQEVVLRGFTERGPTAVEVTTRGRQNAAPHRRLKGEILVALGLFAPPAVARAAAAAAETAAPRAAWNTSLLADGRTVADGAFSMMPDLSATEGMRWTSRSAQADKRVAVFAVPLMGFLVWFLTVFIAAISQIPLVAANVAGLAVGASAALAILFYQLPMMRGHGGVAILNVSGAYATDPTISPLVSRAGARLGLRFTTDKRSSLWHVWKTDVGIKIRFTEAGQGIPARLYVSGRGEGALGPYIRIKGALLEELGAAPPAPASAAAALPFATVSSAALGGLPLASVAVVSPPPPAAQAAAPPFLRLPLPRAPPPAPMVGAPAWAASAAPGSQTAEPDSAMPVGGIDAAPVGWWVASPLDPKGSRQERAGNRIGMAVMVVILLLIILPRIASGASVLSAVIVLAVMGGIFGFSFFFAWRSMGQQRRERYEKNAQSYLRLDPAGASPEALAWAVGAALAGYVPTVVPAPPPPTAAAAWREDTGAILVVLWAPPSKLPYLELTGPGGWPTGARAKGAISAMLFGFPQPTASMGAAYPGAGR